MEMTMITLRITQAAVYMRMCASALKSTPHIFI